MRDLASPQTSPVVVAAVDGPELPAFVAVGPFILDRVAGDWPEELVFMTPAPHGAELWLKSPNLLEGPWDWIVIQGGRVADFAGRPCPTRTEAVAELAEYLARTGLVPATDPDLLSVPAAPAGILEPRPTAPVLAAGAARPIGSEEEDSEVLGWAIDHAIASLRRVRTRYGAAEGVNSLHGH